MKSEPDKLDFLIVVLPLVLVGLLGFQVYQYFQVDHDLVLDTPLNVAGTPGATDEPAAADDGAPSDPAIETDSPAEGAVPPDEAADQGGDPEGVEGEPVEVAEDRVEGAGDEAREDAQPEEPSAPALRELSGFNPNQAAAAMRNRAAQGAAENPESDPAQAAPGEGAGPAGELARPEPTAVLPAQPVAEATTPEPTPDVAEPADEDDSIAEDDASGSTQVYLEFSPSEPVVNDVLAVEINVRNADGAAGTVFHLKYDKALLEINTDPQSEPGPFFEDGDKTRFVINPTTRASVVTAITMVLPEEARSGDGLLATIYFKVVAAGEAEFEFSQASLRDLQNKLLETEFVPASVTLADLP